MNPLDKIVTNSFIVCDYDYDPGATFLVPNNITISTLYPNADGRDKNYYTPLQMIK